MSRIPLSDESLDLDDDVIEEEGSPGKEEQYAELRFETDDTRVYDPELWEDDGDEWADDPFGDELADYGVE